MNEEEFKKEVKKRILEAGGKIGECLFCKAPIILLTPNDLIMEIMEKSQWGYSDVLAVDLNIKTHVCGGL